MTNTAAGVVATTPLAPIAPVVQNLNVVPAGYDPVAPLVALVGGQVGPITAVNQLLCPPMTKVAQLVASLGQPAIASGITTIACSTGILEYKFVTHFKKPDGTIVQKTVSATFGTPTLLDVDGDAIPDYIGTLSLTGTNAVGLTIDRMPTNTGNSPTEIEAVIKDPGGLLLGTRQLRFGFDSTDTNAPSEFVLSTPLNTLLMPSPNFTAVLAQKTPGPKVAVVAGLFDGTYDSRVNPTDLRLAYSSPLTNASINAQIGDHDIISLYTNTVGPMTATGHIVMGTEVQDFSAAITNLPNSLSIDVANGSTVSVGYAASARVATIRASLTRSHVVGSTATILQKAILNLDDVPTGIQVALANGNNSGTVTTTGGPIGLTKIGVANGEPKFLTDAAYVDVDNDGTLQSVSAQLPGLENASFTLTPKITLSATLAATPFRALIKQPGRAIDAHVNNVPHQIDLGFDPSALTLDYDGHGSGIGQVTVAGDSATPFLGRATKIRANIANIPAVLHAALNLTPGGGSFTTTGSSGPIGTIDLLASNGSEAFVPGSIQGVVFHDVPGGEYRLAASIYGLRSVSFDTTNGATVSANTQGGPFSLDVLTAALQATGLIENLPAQTTVGFNTNTGVLNFQGKDASNNPQGINKITLDAHLLTGTLFSRANYISAIIKGIPASETLTLTQGSGQFGVTASDAIQEIDLAAANRVINMAADLPAGTDQAVRYFDQGPLFLASARVLSFKKIIGTFAGQSVSVNAETAGGPFRADVTVNGLTADAEIVNLPAKTTLSANLGTGHITFQGRTASDAPQGIDTLDVHATSTTPLFGRADHVNAHIAGIPSDLTLDFVATGGVSIEASQPISLIEVVAANRTIVPASDLPAVGGQGVNFTDLTGGDYAIAARVRDFKKLSATLADPIHVVAITAGGQFVVNAHTSALTANAVVADLPSSLDATLDITHGKLILNDSAGIAKLTATAHSTTPLFGRATDLDLNIEGIPAALTVDLTQASGGIDIVASQPISLIEVVASNHTPAPLLNLPALGAQGINFTDSGPNYLVAARIRQLKRLAFASNPAITINAQTAGGPFLANIDTATLDAQADIEELPPVLAATLDLNAGKLTVNDSAPIGAIHVAGQSTTALFGRAKNFKADILGVPAVLTLDFSQNGGSVGVSANDTIGSIEVAASNNAVDYGVDLPAGTTQGVVFTDLTGGDYIIGARVRNLKTARIGTGTPLTISTETQGGLFTAAIKTDALAATASIDQLPAKLDATVDLNNGHFTLDGHGSGIHQILVDAHSSTTLFARATDVHALIQDIPSLLDINLAQSGTGVDLTSNAPIGLIELVANNGPIVDPSTFLPAGTEQGAKFVDVTGGAFTVAARVRQLKQLSAHITDTIHISTQTEGGPFTLDAQTDTITGHARIVDLPNQLDIGLDLAAGLLTVDGHGQSIASIDLSAHSTTPLFGRATDIQARILDIPDTLSLNIAQSGAGVNLDANHPIGSIEVAAADRPIDFSTDLPTGTDQGAKFVDQPGAGNFLLAARIRQLKQVDVTLNPTVQLTAKTAGGPFHILVDTASLGATGDFLDLPPVVTLGIDPSSGTFSFAGKQADGTTPQGVNLLNLHVHSATPLFGRATRIDLTINKLAPTVTVDLSNTGTGAHIVTDQPIDSIDLSASDTAAPVDIGSLLTTPQGAVLQDVSSQPFILAVRLLDLQELSLSFAGTDIGLVSKLRSTPFSAVVDTAGFNATALIDSLPAQTNLGLNLDSGMVHFDGHDASNNPVGVNEIALDATSSTPLFGRANTIHADITGVPSVIDVGLASDGTHATITGGLSGTDPIGKIELLVSDGPTTFPGALADPSVQGAVFHDHTGGDFVIAARVLQLRKIDVAFGDNIGLQANTQGGPFAVDIDTDAITATANINDLPANANLGVDLASGQITFTGTDISNSPKGIDLLTLTARLTTPFLGNGNRIDARIEKLPATTALSFSQTTGQATLAAGPGQQLQLLELRAWEDGKPEPSLPAGSAPDDQGATLHSKTGQDFQLAVRLRQLKSLTINFASAVSLHTETAPGKFVADVQSDALTATATIANLPSVLDLGLDLGSGNVTYTASNTVNDIQVGVQSQTPVFLGATNFAVEFKTVPTSFTLGLGLANPSDPNATVNGINLTANNPIGEIDVSANSPGRAVPTIAAGSAGAILDSTNGPSNEPELGLALRVFQLKQLSVTLAPIALEATMQAGTPFQVDANLAPSAAAIAANPSAPNTRVTADILNLPAHFKVSLGDINPVGSTTTGGTKIDYSADDAATPTPHGVGVGEIKIAATGVSLLSGASGLSADLLTVPPAFTMSLPEQPATGPAPPLATLTVPGGLSIGEIRLAAGSTALPATGQPHDLFSYNGDTSNFGVGVRLTGVKGLSVALTPSVNLTLDQVAGTTKQIDLNASLPNTSGPPATITGALNKPTAHTVVGVTLPTPAIPASGGNPAVPATPTRLNLANGTTNADKMANLSLNIANLGSIPSATFTLSNIPHLLGVCLNTDSTCQPTDRIPGALTDYVHSSTTSKTCVFGSVGCTNYLVFPQETWGNNTGGNNRPYPAQVSMDFNDFGTSGSSSNIGTAANPPADSMATVNANIALNATDPHVVVTNLRFHRVELDLGFRPGTSPAQETTFSYLGQNVPKLYMFLDSNNFPFVMNSIVYPPTITNFQIGSDANPATGNKRLIWVPGVQNSGNIGIVTASLNNKTSGTLNCNGTKALVTNGLNLLNLFGVLGQIIPVCSSG